MLTKNKTCDAFISDTSNREFPLENLKKKREKPDKMERAMERAVRKGARKKNRMDACMILRAVSWPKPAAALKYAVYCGIASAAAGAVIYLYQYGVSEIIGGFI